MRGSILSGNLETTNSRGKMTNIINVFVPAEEEPEHVGHDVIDDDYHDWKDEVDETLEQVLDNQVRLGHHDQQSDVGPGEQRELETKHGKQSL